MDVLLAPQTQWSTAPPELSDALSLHQQLQRRTFELEVLSELSQQVNYPLTDRELLKLLLDQVSRVLSIDLCAGLITDSQGDSSILLRPLRPLSQKIEQEIQRRLTEGFEHMTSVAIRCAPERCKLCPLVQGIEPQAIQALGSVFLVPMTTGSNLSYPEIVGMLLIATEAEAAFDTDHLQFLYMVANQGLVSLKQLRTHLAAEKRRLEKIFENLPEGVLLLDQDWHVAVLNPTAQRYLSLLTTTQVEGRLTQVANQPIGHWLPADSAIPRWQEVAAPANPKQVFEISFQSLCNIHEPQHWLMVIRDISERKAIENLKDELIAVISHELRTPLALLQGPLQMLQDGDLGDLSPQGEKIIDIAMEGFQQLSNVIHNVVNLAYLESGQERLAKQQCLTADLLTRALQANRRDAESAQVQFLVQDTSSSLWADPKYLIQALAHLISNAIKFSHKGATIWLEASETWEKGQLSILFTVRDEGLGIPAEQLDAMFDRFQQLDMSSTRAANGLGLGLTVCRLIAQHHNGHLWLDSVIQQGTTAYLCIPQNLDEDPKYQDMVHN